VAPKAGPPQLSGLRPNAQLPSREELELHEASNGLGGRGQGLDSRGHDAVVPSFSFMHGCTSMFSSNPNVSSQLFHSISPRTNRTLTGMCASMSASVAAVLVWESRYIAMRTLSSQRTTLMHTKSHKHTLPQWLPFLSELTGGSTIVRWQQEGKRRHFFP
jgi:hypothetical protein